MSKKELGSRVLTLIRGKTRYPPPFQVIRDWPLDNFRPRVGDSIRLRESGTTAPRQLKVSKVIHDIDQCNNTHTVKVQIFDASPQRVFSDEDIRAMLCKSDNNDDPLFL